MTSSHDVSEILFHDPRAEDVAVTGESAGAPFALDPAQLTPGRTSEEIHRALFSAR